MKMIPIRGRQVVLLAAMAVATTVLMAQRGESAAGVPAGGAATEEIFRKKLDGGGELVFSRTAVARPQLDAAADLLKVAATTNAFRMKVEFKKADAPPLVVLDTLALETPEARPHYGNESQKFNILDVYVAAGEIVVAAGNGPGLGLWRIKLGNDVTSEWTWPDLGPSPAATGWPVINKDNIRVEFRRQDNGRLSVQVYDSRQFPRASPAVVEQDGDQWRFVSKSTLGGSVGRAGR